MIDRRFFIDGHERLIANIADGIDEVGGLEKCREILLRNTYLSVYLYPTKYLNGQKFEGKLPPGATKVGGNPDLPKGFSYPMTPEGGHMIYLAQIKLKEVAPFQDYLPRSGVLYFFVSDLEHVENALVIHGPDDQDLSEYSLAEAVYGDEDHENVEECPVKIIQGVALEHDEHASRWKLSEDEIAIMEELEGELYDFLCEPGKHYHIPQIPIKGHEGGYDVHAINGAPYTQLDSPSEQAAEALGGEAWEWMSLLCLESFDDLNFWDAGRLTFSVRRTDVLKGDFSRVFASIESS